MPSPDETVMITVRMPRHMREKINEAAKKAAKVGEAASTNKWCLETLCQRLLQERMMRQKGHSPQPCVGDDMPFGSDRDWPE